MRQVTQCIENGNKFPTRADGVSDFAVPGIVSLEFLDLSLSLLESSMFRRLQDAIRH